MTLIDTFETLENSAFFLRGLITDPITGIVLIPADFVSIRLEVWDRSVTPKALVVPEAVDLPAGVSTSGYTGTPLAPADVILDPVDTGPLANNDAAGINFRYLCGPSYLPDGGKTYRAEVHVVPVAPGKPFYMPFNLTTEEIDSE